MQQQNRLAQCLKTINSQCAGIDDTYHQAALRLHVADSVLGILYALQNNGCPCPLSAVYRDCSMPKQTAHSALKKMQAQGLLTLSSAPGGKTVCLTPAGHTLLQATAARLAEAEQQALQGWTEQELSDYLRLNQKFADELRKQVCRL